MIKSQFLSILYMCMTPMDGVALLANYTSFLYKGCTLLVAYRSDSSMTSLWSQTTTHGHSGSISYLVSHQLQVSVFLLRDTLPWCLTYAVSCLFCDYSQGVTRMGYSKYLAPVSCSILRDVLVTWLSQFVLVVVLQRDRCSSSNSS